jgi:hypothetical protein
MQRVDGTVDPAHMDAPVAERLASLTLPSLHLSDFKSISNFSKSDVDSGGLRGLSWSREKVVLGGFAGRGHGYLQNQWVRSPHTLTTL